MRTRTSNGRNQASAFRDFGIYGTYAPDMRYRQEQVDAEIGHPTPIIPRRFREWFGTALVRLGTRIGAQERIGVDRQEMGSVSVAPHM